jgi:rhodanese-related sulfurtransferase
MTNTIHTQELRTLRTDHADMLLVDVMPKENFDKDHIKGARNIPVDGSDFIAAIARIAGRKDKKLVVYCAGESCDASRRAANMLAAAGYTDVAAYEGGLSAWRHDVADAMSSAGGQAEALTVAHATGPNSAAGHARSATAPAGHGSTEQ